MTIVKSFITSSCYKRKEKNKTNYHRDTDANEPQHSQRAESPRGDFAQTWRFNGETWKGAGPQEGQGENEAANPPITPEIFSACPS